LAGELQGIGSEPDAAVRAIRLWNAIRQDNEHDAVC
jgi:hypothetical protein